MLSDVNRIKLVSEAFPVFPFSNRKAKIIKFDLAVQEVKVTSGSSFAQTIIGRSPRCYIPSSVMIDLPVVVKKIFLAILPYKGMAAILVM